MRLLIEINSIFFTFSTSLFLKKVFKKARQVGLLLALKLQSQVQGPVNPFQSSAWHGKPSPKVTLCPEHSFTTFPCFKSDRPLPSPRSSWLPAHPHIYVCLLSVFRSPLNCVLAGQTHSTRPKTRQEKVIEFPRSCQMHKKPQVLRCG